MKKTFYLICLLCCSVMYAADEPESEIPQEELIAASEIPEEELIAAVDNLGPTADGYVSEGDFGPEDDNFIDPRVLRDFIESRGLIQCRQKCGQLTIAGDVRARWVTANEQVNGVRVRGFQEGIALNRFKSEFNLFMDYATPCTWVSTKMKWVNFDGKDGGTATRVEMDRAFIGYDIHEDDNMDFYIEAGRSNLGFIFDSRVEFTSNFDGIHLYYTRTIPCVGDFVIHGGPFIVDSFTNHYAWIAETKLLNWANTGFAFIYSIVDWRRRAPTLDYGNLKNSGKTAVRDNPRYRFLVSQMLFGYEKAIDFLRCKTLYAYAAVLVNHDAKRTRASAGRLANGAWYIGFTLGKLCKSCDWSIDLNYQSVGAQAVPEFDLAGIGHGNAANTLLSDAILQGFGPTVSGFANYRGWQLNLLFAMTDTLSLRSKLDYAIPRTKAIGGDFKYTAFEMSAIYAF